MATAKAKEAAKGTNANANAGGTATAPARARPIPAETKRMARAFAALADPARLQVMGFLAGSEAPVAMADLAAGCGLTAEDATGHVSILKQRGYLEGERLAAGAGRGYQYRLSDEGRSAWENARRFGGAAQ